MANEAYKEGLGSYRNGSSALMTKYQNEKDSIASSIENGLYDGYKSFQNIDLEQEYGANNFANITNLLDSLIDTATTNMNQSASLGLNGELESQDLRQIVNLTIANESLSALHDRTANNLKHNSCVMQKNVIVNTMENTVYELYQIEQTLGL